MSTPNPVKIMAFATPTDLEQWLRANHTMESELWVKIFKKHTNVQSVNWDDVVVTCLCWGWIDGIKKSFDEHAYLQRITPRKARSVWSKRNREHVEYLLSQGRMMPSGLAHVQAAKLDGRWEQAYRTSEMMVPEDFLLALDDHPIAKQFFTTLTKSHRNTIAYGLASAKKAATRQQRFEKFLDMLARQEKPR